MGRQRIEKEGYHRHEGYKRLHPESQRHNDVYHISEQEIEQIFYTDIRKAQNQFEENSDVLEILGDIQKGIDTLEIVKELDELISLLLVEGVELPAHNTERQEPIESHDEEGYRTNPQVGLP